MAKKGREAKTQSGQFDIFVDLEEGDEVCFEREGGDNVCQAEVEKVSDKSTEFYGDEVPDHVYLEGPRGGKYVAVAAGMNANEEHVQLYNTPDGYMQNPDPWTDGANLLSFDVLKVVG